MTNNRSSFEGKFMMLSIHRSQYRGLHTLAELKVTTESGVEKLDAAHAQAGKVHLMPSRWTAKFGAVFGEVAGILNRHTTSLRMTDDSDENVTVKRPVLQMRILPTRVSAEVFPMLQAKRREVQNLVRELQDVYDDEVIAWNRSYWEPKLGPEKFRTDVLSKLPPKIHLPHKYRLSWGIFSLSAANVDMIKESELREHMREASQVARQQIDSALAEMIAEPRRLLSDALVGLRDRFSEARVIRSDTFNEVRDAIARVRAFADVGDAQLMTMVRDFENEIENVVSTGTGGRAVGVSFRDAIMPHLGTFNEMARSLADHCNNQTVIENMQNQYGVNARGFDL